MGEKGFVFFLWGGKKGVLGGKGVREGKTSIRNENHIGKKERKKEVWSSTSSENLEEEKIERKEKQGR